MLDQTEKAKGDFEQATTLEPENVASWIAKSDFYGSIGNFDKAINSIQKAMALEPDNLGICKRAIPLFFVSDNRDTVLEGKVILDKALILHPEDIELRVFRARSLLTGGTSSGIEHATNILQKVSEDQPMHSNAWVLLAEIALTQGQSPKAIDIALQGLAHQPNNKSLLMLKAQAEAVRSPALAIPTLKALCELYPNDVDTAVLLANIYITAGEYRKAINMLEKELVSHTKIGEERKIKIALATAFYNKGDKSKTQEIFDSLYESEPNDPSPLLAQAKLLQKDELWQQLNQMVLDWYQDHPEDTYTPFTIANNLAFAESSQAQKIGEEILRVIAENEPDNTEAITALALLLFTTDRVAESAQLYQRVLELEPDNILAINNLAWILCEEKGRPQQALELAERGLEEAPEYIDLIDTRGVVYYRLGKFDKAVEDFNRCINLYPREAPGRVASYFHLGRALVGLGQKNEAIENLNKTLELNDKIGALSATEIAETKRLLEKLL
jgi:tetratricopeptide (TPR) repeat protein